MKTCKPSGESLSLIASGVTSFWYPTQSRDMQPVKGLSARSTSNGTHLREITEYWQQTIINILLCTLALSWLAFTKWNLRGSWAVPSSSHRQWWLRPSVRWKLRYPPMIHREYISQSRVQTIVDTWPKNKSEKITTLLLLSRLSRKLQVSP
jgi:hypothetical protein